ncbi:MAG: hypothetical protein JOZ96_19895 [Acidobacteria bacterium]|nr:hypothetical protein [Acidobacteriota bacterium]
MDKIPGVGVAIVIDVNDPEKLGRLKLRFPWMPDEVTSPWVPVAAPFAGNDRGAYYAPEIGDEALVAFELGNFDHPFVVGFLWNGKDKPPTEDVHLRLFRSVNGHEIAVHDPAVTGGDKGYIRIKDAHGNVVELANAQITIQSVGIINIKAPSVMINGRPVLISPTPI